jgi:hypothetical protein
MSQALPGHGVKVLTFAPHTTNGFQFLDLSFFDVITKKIKSKLPVDNDDDSATALIRHKAFVYIGIRSSINIDPYLPIFDDSVLRKGQGYVALRHRD